MNEDAEQLYEKDKYDAALPLAERALAIREKALGKDHPLVAKTLNTLADLYDAKKDYDRAEQLYQRALAIREKALGKGNPAVAKTLDDFADMYQKKGDRDRAESLFLRALSIKEKALGKDSPEVADTLNSLANVYMESEDYLRAEPLYTRALAIRKKAPGKDQLDLSMALNNLAFLYKARGSYDRAEDHYQRALAIRERALGPEHLDVALVLDNLGALHETQGDYQRAEPLYARALAIKEKLLGKDHLKVAVALNNLGLLCKLKGDYGRAEELYLRAIAIRETALGAYHPDVATTLNNLGLLYKVKGDYRNAELRLERALDIRTRALKANHRYIGQSLSNLGNLYFEKGDYTKAEQLYLHALDVDKKSVGEDHSSLVVTLNNLGIVYSAKGDYSLAKEYYLQALTIQEKDSGASQLLTATLIDNVASLFQASGERGEIEWMYARSLAIREAILGPNHPDVAISLDNLAEHYYWKRDYERAEPLYQRSLAIHEAAQGKEHQAVAGPLANLAELYLSMGDMKRAIMYMSRSEEILDKTLARVIPWNSERQKRAFLDTLSGYTKRAVSLAILLNNSEVREVALAAVLRRKGRALDAMSDSLQALRAHVAPPERALLEELDSVRAHYSMSALRGGLESATEADRKELRELEEEAERLERAISERSALYRSQEALVTRALVQAALPRGAALVEWVIYRHLNDRAEKSRDKYGSPRYAACVLFKKGEPAWVDLGEAEPIDHAVEALRNALMRPANRDVQKLARALDAKVMAPVRKLLGETREVFLSPDSELNLIPFSALVDESGHYLIERYAFTYLTSGRDLLRFSAHPEPREPALVMANPAFDAAGQESSGRFKPLPFAEEEARAVSRLLSGSSLLLRGDATEGRLKKVHGPRVLHIGTHGFFAAQDQKKEPVACSSLTEGALREMPELRSGIALAGANACKSGSEDGLLTALEASALDLYGTKLVVLSACETGVGDTTLSEGVSGLRHALVLAGSETQVMSLWSVSSDATKELMRAYYEALSRGAGRSEAMRQVQLGMLQTAASAHPFYWAAFIVSGDSSSLEGKSVTPDLRARPSARGCACDLGGSKEVSPGWLGVAVAALGAACRRRSQRAVAIHFRDQHDASSGVDKGER